MYLQYTRVIKHNKKWERNIKKHKNNNWKSSQSLQSIFFDNWDFTTHRLLHEELIELFCLPQNQTLPIIQTFLTHHSK